MTLKLLDMLRLRSGPQDMPSGWPLAIAMSFAYIGQGFVADRILDDTDGAARTLLAVGVQFAVIAILLNFRNFEIFLKTKISS